VRIGLFGGTFDPPHIGHQILAAEAQQQLALDRVLWIVTPDPPHKQGQQISSVAQRVELVRAVTDADPAFELCTVELERPGPHYTLDTLHILQGRYPDADLFYLIGQDSLRDLPTWHEPLGVLAACAGLGVMRRPGVQTDLSALEQVLPGLQQHLYWIETPLIEISARDLRQRIASGAPYRYYLPAAVAALVETMGLYRR
jgi:nicotinate-nucleotide adenylyltransferase